MASQPQNNPDRSSPPQERRREQMLTWAAVFVTTILLVLHKPWALHTPQLWAEDGSVFLNDAELYGIRSLFHAYQGYLHLIPRLIVWLTDSLTDVRWWPLCYNGGALLCSVAVLARMTSPRFNVPHKLWLILAFGLVAESGETLLNLTNVQWITAFLLVQQLLMEEPTNGRQLAGDVLLTTAAGLTGPFSVILLPLFAWRTWRGKCRRRWIIFGVIVACAAIQTWFLFTSASVPPTPRPDRFDLLNYLAVLGDRIVIWPYFGAALASSLPSPALAAVGLVIVAAVAALALITRDRRPMGVVVLTVFLLLVAAISWRARPDGWQAHDLANGDRYYFIPRVLFAWLVIWQFDSRWAVTAWTARLLCMLGVLLELPHHAILAPPDYHWAANCDPIRRGVPAKIPTLPQGWNLEYPGRPRRSP
ncbi:MAG TPA: hypothetical protein VHE61_18220 [Opitutaceae bacterium]|nr:hypothetical protein [Opitutaceae bacterium]